MTLRQRFSTWKARRILAWHNICPKHFLSNDKWREEHEAFGCPTCLNEEDDIWTRKFRAKREIIDAKIAAAKAKLAPIEEGTK